MTINRRSLFSLGAAGALVAATGQTASASADPAVSADVGPGPSDEALVRSLPGFRSGYATVNGVRLHYVAGGRGRPLVLLPGWPETWWEFHKIMPALATRYRVIAVDMRGQGGSDKPAGSYDKKTMARDVRELVRHLGYSTVDIVGHDIGAMVAFSFAANHPDATRSVTVIDVAHPNEDLFRIPLLAPPGQPFHLWWFAFNQVHTLPEQLLTGRFRYLVDWLFDTLLVNPAAVDTRDRAIYARAYDQPAAIRAGAAWYQGFYQDIEDQKAYGKITAPMLGIAASYNNIEDTLVPRGTNVKIVKVDGTGHFIPEEQPDAVVKALTNFLS